MVLIVSFSNEHSELLKEALRIMKEHKRVTAKTTLHQLARDFAVSGALQVVKDEARPK